MGKRRFDYILLVLVLGLTLFGILMVFSASFYSHQSHDGDGLFYFLKQMEGAGIGLVIMLVLAFVDYHLFAHKLVWGGILLAALVFLVWVLFTEEVNGAKRWLDLGFVSFQPSEVGRFAMMVFSALWLAGHKEDVTSRNFKKFLRGVGLPFLAMGAVCALILLGKNLSMTAATGLTFICLLVVAGISVRMLALTGALATGLGLGFIYMEPYRVQRLTIFVNPWKDARDAGYQVIQSLYALGAGGLLGVGLGNSRQKYLFLTYSESDFILSIIGEELGFIGVAVLLLVFLLLIWRGVLVAMRAPDTFGMLLAAGIISTIAVQLLINVAVVTSSMPPTGLPLPFVSAGNTSLILFMSEIGILLNISAHRKKAA